MVLLLLSGEDIKGGIAAFIAVGLCVLGIIYAVQNARRSVFYSIWNTRFYRAEITFVETDVYIKWKPFTSRVWSVHVCWKDRNGEMQEEIIETKSRLLGFHCEHASHVRIAEVTTRGKKRRKHQIVESAPVPMVFSPSQRGVGLDYSRGGETGNSRASEPHFDLSQLSPKRLFKSYFGVRDDEPVIEPVPEHEVLFAAQWRRQKLWSFLYALMLLPIVLLLLFLLLAFIGMPLLHAFGFEDPDAFLQWLRNK